MTIRCIKCREEVFEGEDHQCLEVMTLDELFQHELKEVRKRKMMATVPPGQSPEEEGFKP